MKLLHLLMLVLLSGGSAEVVSNFEIRCGGFFARGISPTRFAASQYKQICQTVNGVSYFATFYDTHNKIPVYSAYKFEGLMGCERNENWHIEPQLDDANGGINMNTEGSVNKNLRGLHQALNGEYLHSGYHRGHLAPVYLANSQSCADATFTLTNAAPQNPSFNSIQWRVLEGNIGRYLNSFCQGFTKYIVTGVVPGTVKLNNRVNVPSHFWTAYCCLDQNNQCHYSRGFIGENKNITPQNITVTELETMLASHYRVSHFELFLRNH